MTSPSGAPERFVSAGRLPEIAAVQAIVDDAHAQFLTETSGALSTVYPALERADPNQFGLAVVSAGGELATAGDAR